MNPQPTVLVFPHTTYASMIRYSFCQNQTSQISHVLNFNHDLRVMSCHPSGGSGSSLAQRSHVRGWPIVNLCQKSWAWSRLIIEPWQSDSPHQTTQWSSFWRYPPYSSRFLHWGCVSIFEVSKIQLIFCSLKWIKLNLPKSSVLSDIILRNPTIGVMTIRFNVTLVSPSEKQKSHYSLSLLQFPTVF